MNKIVGFLKKWIEFERRLSIFFLKVVLGVILLIALFLVVITIFANK